MFRQSKLYRIVSIFLMILALTVVSSPIAGAREITDMAGRRVTLPDMVRKVYAPSPYGSYITYSVDPSLLAGLIFPIKDEDRMDFPVESLFDYPDVYLFLGNVLKREERTKKLSLYTRITLEEIEGVVDKIPVRKRPSVYYAEGVDGRVYLIPRHPFNRFDLPPSFMRILGLKWIAGILYPKEYPVDIAKEAVDFYHLFLGVTKSNNEMKKVIYP